MLNYKKIIDVKNLLICIGSIIFLILLGFIPYISFNSNYHGHSVNMKTITENETTDTNISYHFYSYGLEKYESQCYILNNNGFNENHIIARTGYKNYVSLSALDKLYTFTHTSNYDEIIDKFGQYHFYNKYSDAEIFTFYKNNIGEDILNIVLNINNKVHVLKEKINPDCGPNPMFVCKENKYYYILSMQNTERMRGLSDKPNIKINKVNITNLTMNTYLFKIPDIEFDGKIINIISNNEKIYLAVDKYIGYHTAKEKNISRSNLADTIYIYDTKNKKLTKKDLNTKNLDFFIRDKNYIYYGHLDNRDVNNNFLNIQKSSLDLVKQKELQIPINISNINLSCGSPFCKNNKIYLELQQKNNDLYIFKSYSCGIDMNTLKIVNLYEYTYDFNGKKVRYLKKNGTEYFDEEYHSTQ